MGYVSLLYMVECLKLDQFKELKAGCEIVFATPGRLIDMLKMKALTMLRATYLVLDEADRMFDLGFEPQIRSIVGQIRPDRQTLLFSATMLRKVEKLAREILSDPIRVTVGEVGMANEDITQVVHVIPSDDEKLPWLFEKLPGMIDEGDVLVFASKKAAVDEIESQLAQKGRAGDKDGTAYTLITQKEARFAGELVNSLVAAGGKKGRGRGGGGRGVRGVDFGLGIGYNTESNSSSSNIVPSRSVAVTPQRTGMMSQFKTKFVAASSNSPSQGSANSSSVPNRQALRGFVSGGSIGGDVYRTQATSTITPAPAPTSMVNKTATPNTGQNSISFVPIAVLEINPEKGGGAPFGTVNRTVELHHSRIMNYKFYFCCRGQDTRRGFTDHLYRALELAGIHTFRDDDEIKRGENIESELEKAIKESQVSIIVFSKDYASSRWCLNELLKVVERRNTDRRHVVLPVFYDVDPSDVRKQSGTFAEAFARHEERFSTEEMDKVELWRRALRHVASLGGMVLGDR
ncbi:hypothetical protein DVH24_030758 [Malus domestica]|uniref:ADP-ribosyl cyclase/cyclic ADP-ribose hydrolase n=1 Tax=Malus domestica TaxID=3750 RepID=A0A498HG36_MALDO|nr:hypothetical protein DVH24_030758 [Malus domestica]